MPSKSAAGGCGPGVSFATQVGGQGEREWAVGIDRSPHDCHPARQPCGKRWAARLFRSGQDQKLSGFCSWEMWIMSVEIQRKALSPWAPEFRHINFRGAIARDRLTLAHDPCLGNEREGTLLSEDEESFLRFLFKEAGLDLY